MLDNIKNILIAVAITAAVTAITTSSITWKYTSSYYKEQIATTAAISAKALQQATDKVLLAERKNNDITNDLNKRALEQDKIIADAKLNLDKLYNEHNRLYVANTHCVTSSSVAVASSHSSSTRPTEASAGVCELDGRFSEFLGSLAYDASKMRETLLICQQYSQEVEKQRERIIYDK